MRLGLLLKMLLMEVNFVVKVTMNIETPKKNVVFGIPADLCPVLQPLDYEIRISTFLKHSLVFLISTTSAVVFGKLEDNYSILD